MAEEDGKVPRQRGAEAGLYPGRLGRRLETLDGRRSQPEPRSTLELLTTDELKLVLDLSWRGRVLPDGEVRSPWVFQEATPEEWEALERWKYVWGEPLDHLEAAEELLDRMGQAHGWRSREAAEAALLLARLEMPEESAWFVGKLAQAVVNFYAELKEHAREPDHPKVRAAVRRLQRLMEMDRAAYLEASGEGSIYAENERVASTVDPAMSPQQPRSGWRGKTAG